MRAMPVQTPTRYPLVFRLLLGLGGIWLAGLLMLVLAPLISIYGHTIGIPLLTHLTGVMVVVAILVLFLCVPLSWGLGCAGLILEWMSRRRQKPKRKLKRKSRMNSLSSLSATDYRAAAQRLANSRRHRMASTGQDPHRLGLCGTEARERAVGIRSKS